MLKLKFNLLVTAKNKLGFPGGSDGKESARNAGDLGSIPGQEDTLEKGMATHSSILAWRIPRIEEPGGLQSMGLQELDMTEQLTHTHRLDIIHFLHKVIQLSF